MSKLSDLATELSRAAVVDGALAAYVVIVGGNPCAGDVESSCDAFVAAGLPDSIGVELSIEVIRHAFRSLFIAGTVCGVDFSGDLAKAMMAGKIDALNDLARRQAH